MLNSTTIMIIALCCATAHVVSAKEPFLRGTSSSSNSHRRLTSEENNNDAQACSVGVTLTCPIPEPITIDNDCIDPFRVLTFRYNGGDCSQSDNLQGRHDFTCTDLNSSGGSSTTPSDGSENYIVVTSQSGNETYFTGSVAIGEEYTLNANEQYDILTADMTITIYDTEGGNNILQTTDLRLDCSNSLFLFDKFGASQVVSWKETSGRVVAPPETNRTGNIAITVYNPSDSTNNQVIRLVEMTLLSNSQDMPIDYTSEVRDMVLLPGAEVALNDYEFNYDLATTTKYTFFTTIIADTVAGDGINQCNGFHQIECIL